MSKTYLPKHTRIARSDLARLTLDRASARRFEGPFRPAMLGGLIVGCACLLAGYLLYRTGTLSANAGGALGAAGVLPGLAFAFIAHRRMLNATPLSMQSGRPMLPFVIQEGEQDEQTEIAYIDRSSDTYFTELYVR